MKGARTGSCLFAVGSIIAAGLLASMSWASQGDEPRRVDQAATVDQAEADWRHQADAVRAGGPESFAAYLRAHTDQIASVKDRASAGGALSDSERRLLDTIDRAAAQKDAAWSGLFWHTDLDEALARAKSESKPVLSLRLLGNLTDEFSCANSRYFRVALYANREISGYLRDRFVLHWSSERPVPRVTIDYGDGRRLESTITGNSIHYVLAPDGTVFDALPGLSTPARFLTNLQRAAERGQACLKPADHAARWSYLRELSRELESLASVRRVEGPRAAAAPPDARDAAVLTASKLAVERPFLDAVALLRTDGPVRTGLIARASADPLPQPTPAPWSRRMGLFGEIDASSRQLMAAHLGGANAVDKVLDAFQEALGADAVLNETELRPRIVARMLGAAGAEITMSELNRWVYDTVFLTPASDPWLGLKDERVYDGLRRARE